jgi:hypothetical protein
LWQLKKLAAILLIGILCFNWYGYQIVSSWLESRADRQLEARLDGNNYDESQLLSLKVPASHLSYYNSSTQFERVDGQIEIGGVQYKYVKRRLFNDSLEYLCIPNQASMRLQTARNEFYKLVNDLQHNGQGKKSDSHPGSSKSLSSADYYAVHDLILVNDLPFITLPRTAMEVPAITSSYAFTLEQPPDPSSAPC